MNSPPQSRCRSGSTTPPIPNDVLLPASAWILAILIPYLIAHAILLTTTTGSAWNSGLWETRERLLLGAEDPLIMSAVATAAGIMKWVALDPGRLPSLNLQRVGRAVGVMALTLWSTYYVVSWSAFSMTGTFLTADAVRFWAANPRQSIQHALHLDPMELVRTPVLILLLILVPIYLASGTRRLRFTRTIPVQASLVALLAIGAALGTPTYLRTVVPVPPEIYDRQTGVTFDGPALFAFHRSRLAGPLSALTSGVRERGRETGGSPSLRFGVTRPGESRALEDAYLRTLPTHRIDRLNVVILVIESLREDVLRAYGGDHMVMPTVDSLAREGTVYRRSYTTSSQSALACLVPVSGQYPLRGDRVAPYPTNILYPRKLPRQGYRE